MRSGSLWHGGGSATQELKQSHSPHIPALAATPHPAALSPPNPSAQAARITLTLQRLCRGIRDIGPRGQSPAIENHWIESGASLRHRQAQGSDASAAGMLERVDLEGC